MKLLKTSFYTSLSTAVTFISGFIVTKVVAVKIGPAGIAYVGQFQNTISILTMLATGAITSATIKYIANYRDQPEKKQRVLTTALTIVLLCSFTIAAFVISASGYLSRSVFKTGELWLVFVLYGVFITIISVNSFYAAVFNGLKEIKKLTVINITGSLVGIIFTVIFAYAWGIKGVLIANNFTALILFIVNLWFLKKIKGINWKPSFSKWDKRVAGMLFTFALMNVVSGFVTPAAQLIVRNKIIENFSANEAGYWQAITRISDYYLSFITTVLSVYYLPRLSELKEKHELKHEIIKGYKTLLPIVGVMAFLIWLCRTWIVHILFTQNFLPMLPLFKYQLLGDFFKIGSWLLAFLMLSKALVRMYIITEIVFNATFVILSIFFISKNGIIGATYAFCINYALYWVVMWFLIKKRISNND
ncbi:MAG: O-antigen translocase [Ferruginibacter sp.]